MPGQNRDMLPGDVLARAGDPAGGSPTADLIPAAIVGGVALLGLAVLVRAHHSGRTRPLVVLARWSESVPALRGLPHWASLPIAFTTSALVLAVFGFYWDVSTHIDNGRDAGPFANPSHFFILAGLAGIALAGFCSIVLSSTDDNPGSVRLRPRWPCPIGGVLILACGVIALAGFPLDDVWHRIFGQDVTLWGPTHIQMVAGAALSTLAVWVLYVEATRVADVPRKRSVEVGMGASFLVGLAALQAEFDFGVPQFRLMYHPVLLALAGGIGLVTARVRLGRGGALFAALGFLFIRGLLALVVGPVLGRSLPHFPLILVEALVVEAVALAVPRARPLRLGLVAGFGIGTVGFAAEWAWSHAWMPLPWTPSMLAEAAFWSAIAGTAGGVLGGLTGRALTGGATAVRPVRRGATVMSGVMALVALAWPLPTDDGGRLAADVRLREISPPPERLVAASIDMRPAGAAEDAAYFTVTAWQGAEWGREDVVIDHLEQLEPGSWRTSEPIPVYGGWKAVVRLQKGRTLAALPIFLPRDVAIPADEVPADDSFTREFVADKKLLQREFTGGPAWIETMAYGLLAAIALGWIAVVAWGLNRLLSDGRRRDHDRVAPVRVARSTPVPVG